MTLYDFDKNSSAIVIPAAPAPIMQMSAWYAVELSIDRESKINLLDLLEPFSQVSIANTINGCQTAFGRSMKIRQKGTQSISQARFCPSLSVCPICSNLQ